MRPESIQHDIGMPVTKADHSKWSTYFGLNGMYTTAGLRAIMEGKSYRPLD